MISLTKSKFARMTSFNTRIFAAKNAYQSIWQQFEPPSIKGNLITYYPENMNQTCLQEAWHGSSLELWESQINEGRVRKAAQNLFFGDIELATRYALIYNDPILIHLIVKSGKILKDETYGTHYVAGNLPSEVLIGRVYHVNTDYKLYLEDENKPKLFELYKMAMKAAINKLRDL